MTGDLLPGDAITDAEAGPGRRGPKCGTYAGWNQHQVDGTIACDACLAAKRAYQRRWRERQAAGTCVRGLGWPAP